MMRRGALALWFAAGVALSTLADVRTRPSPALVDGFYLLSADFHVHAAFGDGGLTPWDARREAARRDLDVIAITNHNQLYSPRIYRALFGNADLPLLLSGEEVTAPTHHILAIGVSSPVHWNQSAAATIRDIHARGGVAVAAHPHGDTGDGYDTDALTLLDAAERTHPGLYRSPESEAGFGEFFARARRYNPRVAAVGDSDFHFNGRIGLCHTRLLVREVSEAGVLEALRAGRTVAYDLFGRPFGEPGLVAAIEARRRAGVAGTPRWSSWTNVAGAVLAWSALLGLVLLGPSRTSRLPA
jgi:PHP-associated